MTRIFAFYVLATVTACGGIEATVDALVSDSVKLDASMTDSSPDAPDAMPDAAVPSRRKVVASTSGGGTMASTGHRIRVRIGAPQPAGTTASANHRVFTGPGAMP